MDLMEEIDNRYGTGRDVWARTTKEVRIPYPHVVKALKEKNFNDKYILKYIEEIEEGDYKDVFFQQGDDPRYDAIYITFSDGIAIEV